MQEKDGTATMGGMHAPPQLNAKEAMAVWAALLIAAKPDSTSDESLQIYMDIAGKVLEHYGPLFDAGLGAMPGINWYDGYRSCEATDLRPALAGLRMVSERRGYETEGRHPSVVDLIQRLAYVQEKMLEEDKLPKVRFGLDLVEFSILTAGFFEYNATAQQEDPT